MQIEKNQTMEAFYLIIIALLLLLTILNLNTGVSNDAVNFLAPAVGAKAAGYKLVMAIAVAGVFIGAATNNGMMDIARHGIFTPIHFSFTEVMCIFLAVVATDVVLLDIFNSLGLPTSTTVSMVFELLGASFAISIIKLSGNTIDGLTLGALLNTSKALSVVIGIFLSVAIAFFFGLVVQWITRMLFSFNQKNRTWWKIGIFGSVAITAILYFMLIKGMKGASFMTESLKTWIDGHIVQLLLITFAGSMLLTQILYWLKINVFKVIILFGTFALAMAFAGNDLVNFIGVPLAALSSVTDFLQNGVGVSPDDFMMTSLMESAHTPIYFLIASGVIMSFALVTSKKARRVLQTSINLSSENDCDDGHGTSPVARILVRMGLNVNYVLESITPQPLQNFIQRQFSRRVVTDSRDGAAFDLVRASVNIVLAGLLIALGTSLKLPLSTTYVTFMVGMGTSLSDRAWSRESAVFKVTGVITVIVGWFTTAIAAFFIAAMVAVLLLFGGKIAMLAVIVLAFFLLVRSHIVYRRKMKENKGNEEALSIVLTSNNPDAVWDEIRNSLASTLSETICYASETYQKILDAADDENDRALRTYHRQILEQIAQLKRYRRNITAGLRRIDSTVAMEKNTWYHLCISNTVQMLNTLRFLCEPLKEHTDNNFTPLPAAYVNEFQDYKSRIKQALESIAWIIGNRNYTNSKSYSVEAKNIKKELDALLKMQTSRMSSRPAATLRTDLLYLTIIQESHELLSQVRNVLRGSHKLFEQ